MENNSELTAERSLEIIKKQIEQSRKTIEKNSGMPMVIWGALVCVTALIVGHLWRVTENANWNLLWFVMAIIGWGYMVWTSRKEKSNRMPKTFVSQVIGNVWFAFGIFASILPILMFVIAPLFADSHVLGYGYTPLIIVLLGLATTATGMILKSGWMTAGSIIGGLAGFVCAILFKGPYEMMVLVGVSAVMLLIPGIMINRRKDYV